MDIKSTIFFLKQQLRPGVFRQYENLVENQSLRKEELAAVNWHKRKALLNHAYQHVPFYMRRFRDCGLHPEDIRDEEHWQKIPILVKKDIRENFAELISESVTAKVVRAVTTGGSTGQPLKSLHDRRYPLEILGWRMLSWWGLSPADDAAYCWRLSRKGAGQLLNDFMWWPTRRIWLDASRMTGASVEKFIAQLNALRPALIQGYTGSIDFVAQYVLKNNITVHSPKCLWGTSSPISAAQRVNIEGAFGAPLYDQYGCSEIFWLAAQCRQKNGLHFFWDARHIEFVGEDSSPTPAGKIGNVVITDLENYAFPLIRYQNGDRGNFLTEDCTCGVSLPLIAPVKGRTTDVVKTPSGGAVGGDFITTLFDDFPESVRAFQLRQSSDYSIVLSVVPGDDLASADTAVHAALQSIRRSTSGEVKVDYEMVDEINTDRGKTRYVLSEVL